MDSSRLDRRHFLAAAAVVAVSGVARALTSSPMGAPMRWRGGDPRLYSRPRDVTDPAPPGVHQLAPSLQRGALLYVPPSYHRDKAAALVVMFHGYGQHGAPFLEAWRSDADAGGFVILAPDSRGETWDAIGGDFGPDIAFLDDMLDATFHRCRIADDGVVLAGFSDGASYSLSVGIANGDVAGHVIGYSPGGVVSSILNGVPRFFISHGTRDPILPFARTRDITVPTLRSAGYQVEFREFDGGHEIPPTIRTASVAWFSGER